MSVKGLHKMIYPFAPDQSGAAAVLYELGGMIIVCDAGGCAGNICGFDEPRWLDTKSMIFSAGLRDMDAILGRDDLLVKKIAEASSKLEAKFIAIVGTPVPATIATDYRALRRMAEKAAGLPVISMDTSGAGWYDDGIEKAYMAMLERFAEEGAAIPGSVGVLGVTPLDAGCTDAPAQIKDGLLAEGASEVICFDSLRGFAAAGRMERNIVTSAAGLKAARYLKDRFGTPYECGDPLLCGGAGDGRAILEALCGSEPAEDDRAGSQRVLIIHQQVRANALRSLIRETVKAPGDGPDIRVATWFRLDDEIAEPGDLRIKEEADFFDIAENGGFDVIIADESLRRAAKGFKGLWIDFPHFAVSGRCIA